MGLHVSAFATEHRGDALSKGIRKTSSGAGRLQVSVKNIRFFWRSIRCSRTSIVVRLNVENL
jgi:hypothetical protein